MKAPGPAQDIIQALGLAVFEYQPGSGALRSLDEAPEWCKLFFDPSAGSDPRQIFPFLDLFFEEAIQFWSQPAGVRFRSGAWVQMDRNGEERALEAEAIKAGDRSLLLLRLAGPEWEERRNALQALRSQRLASEESEKQARRQSEALQLRSREIERLNKLKSEFIASVSHELRTPLNAIIGFSSLLARGKAGALSAKQESYLAHIQKAAHHLLELVNDVLDLSRIEAGSVTLRLEWFDGPEAIREVFSVIRPLAQTSQVEIAEPALQEFPVYADRLRFKQILYNLLSNAVKFTPKGGHVTIGIEREDTAAMVIVSDNGIGIPEEERDRIFEKYHQARSPDGSVPPGSGLGLAIVKQLVEQHAGNVSVESVVGRGSRFLVRLPFAPPP